MRCYQIFYNYTVLEKNEKEPHICFKFGCCSLEICLHVQLITAPSAPATFGSLPGSSSLIAL